MLPTLSLQRHPRLLRLLHMAAGCYYVFFSISANPRSAAVQKNPAAEGQTSFLGVSPPVRSGCFGGAANPWSHDRSWKMSAYSASSTNLQALRELDSEGESFLKVKESGAGLVVLGLEERLPDPADCSDAGSDTTAVNECAPFTCHTEYFLH